MTPRLRAHVAQGRIVVDELVDLPDGTEVHVEIVNDSEGLDDENRARLHAAGRGQDELDRCEGIPAGQLIAELCAVRQAAAADGVLSARALQVEASTQQSDSVDLLRAERQQ